MGGGDLKPPVLYRAAELFRDGHTVRQVADLLGVSRSEAGRLRLKAAAEGILARLGRMRARRSKRLWKGVFGSIRGVPKSQAIGHRGLGQPCGHPSFVRGQGGGAENQRPHKGRNDPGEVQGRQNRRAKARDRTAPKRLPTGCQGRDTLRHCSSRRRLIRHSACQIKFDP